MSNIAPFRFFNFVDYSLQCDEVYASDAIKKKIDHTENLVRTLNVDEMYNLTYTQTDMNFDKDLFSRIEKKYRLNYQLEPETLINQFRDRIKELASECRIKLIELNQNIYFEESFTANMKSSGLIFIRSCSKYSVYQYRYVKRYSYIEIKFVDKFISESIIEVKSQLKEKYPKLKLNTILQYNNKNIYNLDRTVIPILTRKLRLFFINNINFLR